MQYFDIVYLQVRVHSSFLYKVSVEKLTYIVLNRDFAYNCKVEVKLQILTNAGFWFPWGINVETVFNYLLDTYMQMR